MKFILKYTINGNYHLFLFCYLVELKCWTIFWFLKLFEQMQLDGKK